ncbi:MAG: hypothetical protein ABR521_02135 [Gaiellaceae bacterium]
MAEQRWERLLPLAGVLATVLWLIGVFVIESGDTPGENATPQQVAAHFDADRISVILGGFLFALGSALFLVFLGSLRTAFDRARGGPTPLSAALGATGLATGILSMGAVVPGIAAGLSSEVDGRPVGPEAADALWALGDGFFVVTEAAGAVFLVAFALLVLRTRLVPVWLGWASLALGAVMLVPPIGWAAVIFGLPVWTVLVGALLLRRGEAEPTAASA